MYIHHFDARHLKVLLRYMVTLMKSLQYNKSSSPRDKSNPSGLGMLNVFKKSCLGVTVVKLRLGKGEWEYRRKGNRRDTRGRR